MFPAFSTALSALNAVSTAIDVVGNNLANLNTTGYKANEVGFHDLMSQSLGGIANATQVGMGVGQISTARSFLQGSIQTTNGATDAAIEGDGFFVVSDQSNQMLYTRAGNFQVDPMGNLITATGERVQGWSAVNGTLNPNGAIGDITLPLGAVVPATATTKMTLSINLDSRVATTDPGATFSTPIQVFDSQGAAHILTATFTKTGANAWDYAVSIPPSDLSSGGQTTLNSGTLTFDGSGNLETPAASADPQSIAIAGLANGASDMNIAWNLYDGSGNSTVTQFAQTSGASTPSQNGFAAGQILKISLQNSGILVANYSNGDQVTVGQVALASIRNPGSLIAVGNNNFQASAETAPPAVGAAYSGGRGQIVGGALESSTADIATEFTKLLTYERSYQAASRVITTSDQLLQETVNLIHP